MLGLVAGALAWAPAADAQPVPSPPVRKQVPRGPEDQALALHDEARDLYEKGDYRGAIGRLEKALALDPEGKELVYNLALIHEKLAEIEPARRYYERYLSMESDPAMIEKTQKALKRLEGARTQLLARDPATASAEPPVPPPPKTDPAESAPQPKTRRPVGTWVWITGGVSASALLVGNFFAFSALAISPGDDARTGGEVGVEDLQADAESAHRRAVVADVSFAVALVAAGAAVYLYLSTPPERASGQRRPPRRAAALSF